MATDATGTPTSLGIPKLDTANDAPSGLGINAMMDAIDALIAANPTKPAGIVSGEVPVWNGTTWVRSSVTRINTVRPQDLGQDSATTGQVLKWDGSKWAPAAGSTSDLHYSEATANVTLAATASASATTILAGAAVTYANSPVFVEFTAPRFNRGSAGGNAHIEVFVDGTSVGEICQTADGNGGNGVQAFGRLKYTPSAGSHTISIRGWTSTTGDGVVQCGAGGAATLAPAALRIYYVP